MCVNTPSFDIPSEYAHQKIQSLQNELDGAMNLIAALILKYGRPDNINGKRRIVMVDIGVLTSAPRAVMRWDDAALDQIGFGVWVDE